LLFVVDASGSMAARRRMTLARGVVRRILLDAYRRRDQVALIAFGGAGARLILPPTNSIDLAERRLAGLRSGGRTPLAAALLLAQQTLARQRGGASLAAPLVTPLVAPLVVLVSDGKANQAPDGADPWAAALRAAGRLRRDGVAAAVVDADQGPARLGLIPALAEALGGTVIRPGAVPHVAAAVQRLAVAPPRSGRWAS
jgi:magnesium chelatase subunit D